MMDVLREAALAHPGAERCGAWLLRVAGRPSSSRASGCGGCRRNATPGPPATPPAAPSTISSGYAAASTCWAYRAGRSRTCYGPGCARKRISRRGGPARGLAPPPRRRVARERLARAGARRPPNAEQDGLLRNLLAQIPRLDPNDLRSTLHPPRAQGTAGRAGAARPVAGLPRRKSPLGRATWPRWPGRSCRCAKRSTATCGRGSGLALAVLQGRSGDDGEALFVPARGAAALVLLQGSRLALAPAGAAG